MLEKNFYKQLLKSSFSIPIEVTYWDHTTEKYGEGTPQIKIIFNEPVAIKDIMNNASLALGEAYMDKKFGLRGGMKV